MTTGLEFCLRRGLSDATIMRHEHVNTAAEVVAVVAHFYRRCRRVFFGAGPRLCGDPDTQGCRAYLGAVDLAECQTL